MRPTVLAVTSDQQCGSTTSLVCPEGVRLDDGGRFEPSILNLWLWQCWEDYWARVRETVKQWKADLTCVFNGDMVEGRHHKTLQLIDGGNEEAQAFVATRMLEVPRALKPKHVVVVRGTPAHVGPLAEREEELARWFKAERHPTTRKWSWWHWRAEIHGVHISARHHPATKGMRPWTRAQGFDRLSQIIYFERTLKKLRPYDLAFRAHIHHKGDSFMATPTRVISTGAWQFPTEFIHRIGAEDLGDFGGAITVIEPNGKYHVEHVYLEPAEEPIWRSA